MREFRLVLDDQDVPRKRGDRRVGGRHGYRRLGARQVQLDRGAQPRYRVQPDLPARGPDDARGGGQAQPGGVGLGREERLEGALPLLGVHAAARVGQRDPHEAAAGRKVVELARFQDDVDGGDGQHAAAWHGVARVGGDVDQYLLQRSAFGVHRLDVGRDVDV